MHDSHRVLTNIRHVLDRALVDDEARRGEFAQDFVTACRNDDGLDFRLGKRLRLGRGLILGRPLARNANDEMHTGFGPKRQSMRTQNLAHDVHRVAGLRFPGYE